MKYIIKNPKLNEAKPYILRFHEPIKSAFDGLVFEQGALEPIEISNYQKDYLGPCACTFWIVSYYPLSVIRKILAEYANGLAHYAFCCHDKDVTADGELKKTHTHLLLNFDSRVSASYVAFLFHSVEVSVISTTDVKRQFDYLIHDSERCRKEHKYQYSPSERIADDFNYWKSRCFDTPENANERFVQMIDDYGDMPMRDLIRKYGATAFYNIKTIRLWKQIIRDQEHSIAVGGLYALSEEEESKICEDF